MTPQEMTEIRNKRLIDAYNMKKPDRIPMILVGQGFFKWIDPTAVVADLHRRPKYVDELTLQAFKLPIIEELDTGPRVGFMNTVESMDAFATVYFAKMMIPGRDLSDDVLWNIHEMGPMTEEDYDVAIDKGWGYMSAELLKRIGFDPSKMPPPDTEYLDEINSKFAELGKATFPPAGNIPLPSFEALSGARKMTSFMKDLRRMPEKVRAVLDTIEEDAVEKAKKILGAGPLPPQIWIGGTRAGSDFISTKYYEKFYHTHYQKIIPLMHEAGVKAQLHNDSDWSGFLKYFREFPKASCVWDPDQLTPMETAKEIIGDMMCMEGNIPPSLLAVGTPDECYKYTRDMIDLCGDTGFIVAAGCSVPLNARRENLEACILATIGK